MKKFLNLIIIVAIFSFPCAIKANSAAVPQNSSARSVTVSNDYSKMYKTSPENLLYILLAALNDVNYTIEEIRFKTGCVLFKAYSKEFVASIASGDGYNSFINITPVDNVYNFQPSLIQKLHKYIDLNSGIGFQRVL